MNIMEKLTREQAAKGVPDFRAGDTVRVHVKIREGDKERLQVFEGVVIRRRRGDHASFTVRKTSYGVGVERVFPMNSPAIHHIEVAARGKVRRSRLYYLRELRGKRARIQRRSREELKAERVGDDATAEAEEPPAAEA
jgi:large subunit ribosomal protein L19